MTGPDRNGTGWDRTGWDGMGDGWRARHAPMASPCRWKGWEERERGRVRKVVVYTYIHTHRGEDVGRRGTVAGAGRRLEAASGLSPLASRLLPSTLLDYRPTPAPDMVQGPIVDIGAVQ